MRIVRTLITRLTAVLAVAGAVVLAAPGTATAGGPTSVLLASPYTGSATGLYYTDPDYEQLQALLGGPDLPAGAPQPPGVTGSPYVTATWFIHDVFAWRIDRIFLPGDDIWVVSEMSGDGGPLTGDGMYPGQTGDAGAVWHRPTDPAALGTLLAAHGLTPGSGRAGSGESPATEGASLAGAAPTDASPAAAAPIQPAATSAPSPAGTGWPWGIGGLLVGLLLGGAIVRATMGRRTVPGPEPVSPPDPARMQPID
ncbi:hypothetical protein [Nakamurella sp.]|uniref:hypothetical protein n=1 Tax=Nakamurella sp. TaxID=1869182 RepID=UPI0037834495